MTRWQTAALLAIGFAGLLVYAYPGYMSSDSAMQLADARSHQFSDWHPPAMAALWSLLELVIAGPALMLIVQGTLFLLGTYGVLRHALSDRQAAIVASAILLFPPVLAPMAVIWKDSQMAGFLLAGVALVLEASVARRVTGIVLLTLACAMRDNAAVATLPLIVLLFRWRQARWRIATALLVWAMTVAAAKTANRALTRVELHAWYVSLGPPDIIGTLKKSRKYSDAELIEILRDTTLVPQQAIQTQARKYYNPQIWWDYMSGPRRIFNWPETPVQRAAFARAWWELVRANPGAYVLHRFRVFQAVLCLGDWAVFDPVWHTHVAVERLGMDSQYVAASGIQEVIGDALTWTATTTPLFRPSIYFFVTIAFVWLARRQRDVLALLLSGLVYELSLVPFAPSADYRYSHWLVVTTIISSVMLFARRKRQEACITAA